MPLEANMHMSSKINNVFFLLTKIVVHRNICSSCFTNEYSYVYLFGTFKLSYGFKYLFIEHKMCYCFFVLILAVLQFFEFIVK